MMKSEKGFINAEKAQKIKKKGVVNENGSKDKHYQEKWKRSQF